MARIVIPKIDWEIKECFRIPLIYCPTCSSSLLGNSAHQIEENGDVNASVVCPCGFHEFVTLEDWNGGKIPKAQYPKT